MHALVVDPDLSQGGCAALARYARPCCPSGRAALLDRLGRVAALQRRARQLSARLEQDGSLGPPQDWRHEVYRG